RQRCLSIVLQTARRESMKRYRSAAGIALAVLAVLGHAGPALAQQQVPFKGSLEGVVTVTPQPPYVSVLVKATGNGTQLGQFALASPHLVNRANMTATGTYQFVAANGDTLTASFNRSHCPNAVHLPLSAIPQAVPRAVQMEDRNGG